MKPNEILKAVAMASAINAAAVHAARVLRASREQIGSHQLAAAIADEVVKRWQSACREALRDGENPDLAAFSGVMREAGIAAAVRVFGSDPVTIQA